MKITTKEDQDAQFRATVAGGFKGLAGGLAVALPTSYIAHRRLPYYRSLPPSLKAFSIILVAVPAFVISADRAGLRYEREHWSGVGKQEIDTVNRRLQERWDSLTLTQKIKDTAARHEYGCIAGAWAATMVGAFGYIMRDPYQSMPQKLVQARMWAQGLTIGVLIAAGALTHARHHHDTDDRGVRHLEPDHSWQDIVAQEERQAPPPS